MREPLVQDCGLRWASWAAIAALAGVVVVTAALPAREAPRRRSEPRAILERDALAPDPAIVRYRYTAAPAAPDDLDATIEVLEARTIGTAASPFDLGELAELYLRRARRSGDARDHAAAEAAARRSLAIMPRPNTAPLTLAKLANARHEFREAIRLGREYLKHASSPAAHIALATAHLAVGELPLASEAADAAVTLAPTTSSYVMRALVLQAQGRDAEAVHDFARACAVEDHGDPAEAARTRTLWGRFLLRRGAYASAKLVLDEALRIAPDDAFALAQHGELALRSGRPTRARAAFERAFASSREVRYLIDQARAQEVAGDLGAATSTRAQVERLVRAELREHGLGHRLDLVEILVDRGRPADLVEAIALAREEVAERPSAETRFQLARALARAGDTRDALAHVRASLAMGTRDARLYELAARLEAAGGNPERAAVYAREAAALDPVDAGWRTLGIVVADGARS